MSNFDSISSQSVQRTPSRPASNVGLFPHPRPQNVQYRDTATPRCRRKQRSMTSRRSTNSRSPGCTAGLPAGCSAGRPRPHVGRRCERDAGALSTAQFHRGMGGVARTKPLIIHPRQHGPGAPCLYFETSERTDTKKPAKPTAPKAWLQSRRCCRSRTHRQTAAYPL